MTEVKGSVVEGRVEVEIHIDAPPAAVFEFLVDPEKMLRWMGQKVDMDPRPGGRFWMDLGDDAAEGEFVEVVPSERVVVTWGWVGSDTMPPGSSTVTFELRPSGTGTTVSLVHTDLPDEACDKHLEGWLYFGGRLSVAGAGGVPDA